MRKHAERVNKLETDLRELINGLDKVPQQQQQRADNLRTKIETFLSSVPSLDTQKYIHIIGLDKSFKTSYILDLFDNDILRDILNVREATTVEHTAVPCLILPAETQTIQLQKWSLETKQVLKSDMSPIEFRNAYDLQENARPDNYMLCIKIPQDKTPMKMPVIEYPGIKKSADASADQRALHEVFRKNMVLALRQFPGLLVACFKDKVYIPEGHPLATILQEYAHHLKTDYIQHKLPLVLSMHGELVITSYCGNSNVPEELEKDFQSHERFDTKIQLIHPKYPRRKEIVFAPKGPNVDEWIHALSSYKDLDEIKTTVNKDGGISWSRKFLQDFCAESHLQEALDNIYLSPWIATAEKLYAEIASEFESIRSFDVAQNTRKKMQTLLVSGKYKPLRDCFMNKWKNQPQQQQEPQKHQQALWETTFVEYFSQFEFGDGVCQEIAKDLWQSLMTLTNPSKGDFLATKPQDVPYILLNIAELYIPNALMRGDSVIYGRLKS